MGVFAWRNLLTRPMRTLLALIGLTIPILGVLGLFSLSDGLRNLVGDTLNQIEGVIVLRENSPSPVLSTLPIDVVEKIRAVPGVRAAAPEVWGIAPNIEDQGLLMRGVGGLLAKGSSSILDQPVISGQDFLSHQGLKSAVFPRSIKERGEGRFLDERDIGKSTVVISRKIARNYPDAEGNPRKLGDHLKIGDENCEIIGIYETGSMLLDVVLVMDIHTARRILKMPVETLSCVYVEAETPPGYQTVVEGIEAAETGLSARSMNEVQANFGMLMGQVDKVLMMIVSLALLVGIVGIINTMLMSTTERFVEFGVLRTNGWSQGNVLSLVTLESAYLGLLSGCVACLLAWLGTSVANQFLGGGLKLGISPSWLVLGMGLSLATGVLGGLYPAWRASRMVPMEAIRLGSH